ncbi:hypothetical protein OROMI_006135 [Orobanche minor]
MEGLLYHEVQESKLCAVHCVNTVLQGPFFSEFDLAALASDLDRTERQMMLGAVTGDFLPKLSHNVSLDGDFSIQVKFWMQLKLWPLDVRFCLLPDHMEIKRCGETARKLRFFRDQMSKDGLVAEVQSPSEAIANYELTGRSIKSYQMLCRYICFL